MVMVKDLEERVAEETPRKGNSNSNGNGRNDSGRVQPFVYLIHNIWQNVRVSTAYLIKPTIENKLRRDTETTMSVEQDDRDLVNWRYRYLNITNGNGYPISPIKTLIDYLERQGMEAKSISDSPYVRLGENGQPHEISLTFAVSLKDRTAYVRALGYLWPKTITMNPGR
ncbi:hypothetical protein JXC34_06270 [Candidatus Woesearchaeota archaeon]|nr:hypothetical protein [Candidatus Woesearchaeota archaeon]